MSTRQEDEEILAAVRALQAGAGPDAFAPIARRYWRPLFTFFSNRPALRDRADDLVQETFIRAQKSIRSYRAEAAFSTWLRQIAENVWKNAVRDEHAAKRWAPGESLDTVPNPEREDPPALKVADAAPTPEQAALVAERAAVIRSAVEALPPGMRTCTELRLYSDLQDREISDVTGLGLPAVRSHLYEARKRLRPVLEQYLQGGDF